MSPTTGTPVTTRQGFSRNDLTDRDSADKILSSPWSASSQTERSALKRMDGKAMSANVSSGRTMADLVRRFAVVTCKSLKTLVRRFRAAVCGGYQKIQQNQGAAVLRWCGARPPHTPPSGGGAPHRHTTPPCLAAGAVVRGAAAICQARERERKPRQCASFNARPAVRPQSAGARPRRRTRPASQLRGAQGGLRDGAVHRPHALEQRLRAQRRATHVGPLDAPRRDDRGRGARAARTRGSSQAARLSHNQPMP